MRDILLSFGLIILAGVAFRRFNKGGIESETLRPAINAAVLNLFLPALCIKTVYASSIDIQSLLIPVAAWIATLITLMLSVGIYGLFGRLVILRPQEKGVLLLAATFGNVTYLGLPVLTALYGSGAAKYALFYDLLAVTPLLWLVGASIASKYGGGGPLKTSDSLKIIFGLPPIWGILAGAVLKALPFAIPSFVMKALEMLGGLVVPLMIFSIGLALTIPRVQHAYAVIPAVLIKLFIAPVVSYTAALLLGLSGEPLQACLLEGAMPTMVLSLLIAARFHLDASLAAFVIVITTALSFFTLSAAIHLVQGFIR